MPTSSVLLVEVADTSLAFDRLRNGSVYAPAGVAEDWVINLVDEVLEVYREPERAPSRWTGWKYASVRLLKRNGSVTYPPIEPGDYTELTAKIVRTRRAAVASLGLAVWKASVRRRSDS